jgi:hypothetical protein
MVWIPGSNNGTWGMGMSRGAVFPANMGGPFGYQGYPLPNMIQHPTGVMDKPYQGRSFGTVYELTPGGVTTERGWGFANKAKYFGKSRRRRSRRNSTKMHRCEGIKENGKRCKHKTSGQYCKHHLKQTKRSMRRNRRRSRR